MKIIYIAHPVGAIDPVNDFDAFQQVYNNLTAIKRIVRDINLNEPEIVPFAPYVVDCQAMKDYLPAERERGIKNNIALLKAGFVNEIRLYGDRISKGMLQEIHLADALGIPVTSMTPGTAAAII
jgi:hypothetical protein